jgi:hypothetical protein
VRDLQATPPTKVSEGQLTDNLTDRLPDALGSMVAKKMRAAYHLADPLQAQAELEALARELDRSHPGAASSLREGLAETLRSPGSACRRRWPARSAAPKPSLSWVDRGDKSLTSTDAM